MVDPVEPLAETADALPGGDPATPPAQAPAPGEESKPYVGYQVILVTIGGRACVTSFDSIPEVVEELRKLYREARTDPLMADCSVFVIHGGQLLPVTGGRTSSVQFPDGSSYEIGTSSDGVSIVKTGKLMPVLELTS